MERAQPRAEVPAVLRRGFPYEHDQWISSMATGWSTAALASALGNVSPPAPADR